MDSNNLDVNCDIVFDNEAKAYQSGQTVGVQVNLTFITPAKCRCKSNFQTAVSTIVSRVKHWKFQLELHETILLLRPVKMQRKKQVPRYRSRTM